MSLPNILGFKSANNGTSVLVLELNLKDSSGVRCVSKWIPMSGELLTRVQFHQISSSGFSSRIANFAFALLLFNGDGGGADRVMLALPRPVFSLPAVPLRHPIPRAVPPLPCPRQRVPVLASIFNGNHQCHALRPALVQNDAPIYPSTMTENPTIHRQ
eukprot:scaffold822_cov130-Cylindrotheca_fusiformis.AAC.8